ncbi:MAG: hypothetical protein ACE5E5_00040 [Phycisphaerae bacterium]
MKATVAVPLLLVAAIATMGFSAWSPGSDPSDAASQRVAPDPPTMDRGVDRPTGTGSVLERTDPKVPDSPRRVASSDSGGADCPLLRTRPFRRTLGYPCLACSSRMAAGASQPLAGSIRHGDVQADQSARAKAIDRLREHDIISAVDARSSAAILWVKDGFAALDLTSMRKVVDLVFTFCVVDDHSKNMLLIYDIASRRRIGTFTEQRGLRMVEQLAQR